jgi:hypothetical protein
MTEPSSHFSDFTARSLNLGPLSSATIEPTETIQSGKADQETQRSETTRRVTTNQYQAGQLALKAFESAVDFKRRHRRGDEESKSEFDDAAQICQDSLMTAGDNRDARSLSIAFGKYDENVRELNNYWDPTKINGADFDDEARGLDTVLSQAVKDLSVAAYVSYCNAQNLRKPAEEALSGMNVDRIWRERYKLTSTYVLFGIADYSRA